MIAHRFLSTTARVLSRRPPPRSLSRTIASTAPARDIFDKITFIGTGKMSQAMISPLVAHDLQSASSITAYDVSDAALAQVDKSFPGVKTASSIPEAIHDSDLIVYGVKPQNVCRVHSEIRRARSRGDVNVRDDAIILSVVAGKPIQDFVDGSSLTRIARSMPNTPAQIGAGVTVWTCTDDVDAADRKRIGSVLNCFGKTVFVEDESFIDMSTSISGSGPAYVFLLMEAMIDAGVHMGFSRETATTLVHHTLLGSTKFAMETGEHPAILRNSVTSPAGTTASAIYELENGKFRTVIKDAIWACYRRSLEMGGQSSQVGPNRAAPSEFLGGGIAPGKGSSSAPSGTSHHPVEPPMGEMRVQSSFGETLGKKKR